MSEPLEIPGLKMSIGPETFDALVDFLGKYGNKEATDRQRKLLAEWPDADIDMLSLAIQYLADLAGQLPHANQKRQDLYSWAVAKSVETW